MTLRLHLGFARYKRSPYAQGDGDLLGISGRAVTKKAPPKRGLKFKFSITVRR